MMHYHPKKLFCLLALLPTALAGKSATITKTFKFKDAFFIKFDPLATAIGPDNVGVLMSALEDFAGQFGKVWSDEIESTLQDGACTVDDMSVTKFSICDYKYPDLYDLDELPAPGQCYEYENGFVQRIYYKIKKLEISCPEDFYYDDLDRDAYTEAAFSQPDFLNMIYPPNTECDNDDSNCLFATADAVEWSSDEVCTANLFINRFVEIPVYLKCLDYTDGYGPKVANKLIKALDKFFEKEVTKVLAEKIMIQAPEGSIYNFVSPYASDRKYCGHGSWFANGSLTNQILGGDGILVTKFTYGFDVIWYKPKNFDRDELLEGEDVPSIISSVFEDGDFLSFLRQEYDGDEYDFIQDIDECDLIDPYGMEDTFAPTEEPTYSPTTSPSKPPTLNPSKSPTLSPSKSPTTSPSKSPTLIPSKVPTTSPSNFPTSSPSKSPTVRPSPSPLMPIIITSDPTIPPSTKIPTISPSLQPVTPSPTISASPSKFVEPSVSPSQTVIPSSMPTPLPTLLTTPNPTVSSTSGSSETEGGSGNTLSPTPLITKAFPDPTTPSPTCPKCIIHPDDLEEDECPLATTGTCGDGKRGDGICPYAGYCCSEWGYCGTTDKYCRNDSVAPTPSTIVGAPASPTYSKDAGQCADGKEGDGFCPDESSCCSDWGYCGSGEQYCFTTRSAVEEAESEYDGTCGGGGIGDGTCKDDLCCSRFGFCGEGELYCTGLNDLQATDASTEEAEEVINNSPLPDDFKPEFGFRCGFTEVDARSNCKSKCIHHTQCADGEECWGIQLNYCNTFEEGEHPVCTNLDLADTYSRCGYDETSARGHCGPKCLSDIECGVGEYCFPTMLNLCDCNVETCPEESAIVFYSAKALISPYFVQSNPFDTSTNSVEGKPRNSSYKMNLGLSASLLWAFALLAM